jgi:hypothetical protein
LPVRKTLDQGYTSRSAALRQAGDTCSGFGNDLAMDDENRERDGAASGRDKATESEPTEAGHSTSATQPERNREDEPPG